MPLFHVTGEVPVLLNSFVIGRGMVLMPKWDAGEALRLIEQEKITYFVGVPTMSLELMQHPDRDKYDLSSLTDIAAGGAPRPVAHVKRLEDSFRGAQPALGYGLTETNAVGCGNFWSAIITTSPPRPAGRSGRSSSSPSSARATAHLPAGERGEIAIRSAANIRGYWRDAAATAAAFTADGYLRTGDIGYLDEDDYLFIVDRKKDIIIRGGENISCQEVEAAIYAHAAVSEAARVRSARRAARRGAGGGGLFARRTRRSTRRRCATSSPAGSPRSSCRRISGSMTSRCPSSAPARSTR